MSLATSCPSIAQPRTLLTPVTLRLTMPAMNKSCKRNGIYGKQSNCPARKSNRWCDWQRELYHCTLCFFIDFIFVYRVKTVGVARLLCILATARMCDVRHDPELGAWCEKCETKKLILTGEILTDRLHGFYFLKSFSAFIFPRSKAIRVAAMNYSCG